MSVECKGQLRKHLVIAIAALMTATVASAQTADKLERRSQVKNSRANQERLSVEDQLNDEISSCWYRPKFAKGTTVVPARILFTVNRDGSFQTRPVILNPQLDRNSRSLARRALDGLNRCAPFQTVKNNPSAYGKLYKIELTFHPFPKPPPQGR